MTPPTIFTTPNGRAEFMQAYEAVLAEWPVPYQEIDVPTSWGGTHVIASGPGGAPPVVLLHALSATAASWYRIAGALSQGYRVYAVDVLGEGNKSVPARPFKSLDDFLNWFTEVIDGLGIQALYVVGNSYGGFTGAYYAMKLPGRIRRLALIGPAATIAPMLPFYIHMFIPKLIYMLFPRMPGFKAAIRRSVDWIYGGLTPDPLWDTLFYKSMVHGSLINQVFPRTYSRDEFSRIEAKTLLIVGEQERIYNSLPAAVQSARDRIPGLEVEIIPNANHIAAVSNPERVSQALLRFFEE